MPIIIGKKQECPDCGEIAFGCLHIAQAWGGKDYIELACERCCTTYRADLPKLSKKVLYLDQLAISHMMHAREQGTNERWGKLFARLKKMIGLERIICPTSHRHRDESELSSVRFKRLMETCRTLAMGSRLRPSWEVQTSQIRHAHDAFLKGEEAHWALDHRDAFEDDPNAWHDMFTIDIDWPHDPEQASERRGSKMAVHKVMESLYADPAYVGCPFEEHVRRETNGFARGLIGAFCKEMKEIQEMWVGTRTPDPAALLGSPGARMVQMILEATLPVASSDPFTKVRDFFSSAQFASVPAVRINAIMRALMALKSRDSGRRPKPSDQYDVEVISAYLPYCDAMLIDGEMRSFAHDGKGHLDREYKTELFSAKTLSDLHGWLDVVEASFPADQRNAVAAVNDGRFSELPLQKGTNLIERRKSMCLARPTPRRPRMFRRPQSESPGEQ